MSNKTGTVSIGNRTEDVNAALAVFIGDDNLPKPVSEEKPLPVRAINPLNIPSDYDRIEFSPDQETCTLLKFKKNGNVLMALYFQRNAENKVTAIGID
jgi:hypothetical protein